MSWLFVEWGPGRPPKASLSWFPFRFKIRKSLFYAETTTNKLPFDNGSLVVACGAGRALSSSIGRDTSFRTSHQDSSRSRSGKPLVPLTANESGLVCRVAWRSASAQPAAPSSVRFSSPLEVNRRVHGCHAGASNGQCHHLPAPHAAALVSTLDLLSGQADGQRGVSQGNHGARLPSDQGTALSPFCLSHGWCF